MYEKLARGHATAHINGLHDYQGLVNWLDGPKAEKATQAFERSSFSKKPGRVLKRLTPFLHPCFGRPKICQWTRQYKVIAVKGLTSTAENHVFRVTDDDTRPLYSERAAFMTELLFSQDLDRIRTGVITCTSISHHAIARLLEREAVRPEDLASGIFLVLDYSAAFAEKTLYTAINHTEMQSFMLPFARGALVAVFMDMDPARMHKGQERRRILSVRTWLDEGMLSDIDLERMGGLEDITRVTMLDQEKGHASFLRWIEGNARPWSFSDATLEGKGTEDRTFG